MLGVEAVIPPPPYPVCVQVVLGSSLCDIGYRVNWPVGWETDNQQESEKLLETMCETAIKGKTQRRTRVGGLGNTRWVVSRSNTQLQAAENNFETFRITFLKSALPVLFESVF